MKGVKVDCKTGKIKYVDDGAPFPEPPPQPKLYIVYKTIKTVKGREIKMPYSEPTQLDPDEIADLEAKGYAVKVVGET